MRSTSHYFILVSVLICLFSHGANALEFRLLSWEGPIDGWHYKDSEGNVHALSIQDHRLSSQTYMHRGEGPVEFYVQKQTADELAKVITLSISPPQGTNQAILLVKRNQSGQAMGLWLNDSLTEFPAGSMKIYNFTQSTAMLEANGKAITLNPSESFSCPIPQGARAFPLKGAALDVDGNWKLFTTLPIPLKQGKRVIVFIREAQGQERKQIAPATLLTIYDSPPVKQSN